MMIFSGSSNLNLARKLARKIKVKLGKIELSKFDNDEIRVWIREEKIDNRVTVVQSLSSPTNDNLIELVLIGDALRRRGVKEITAVIPWLGYSKQDKVFRPGEPLSVKVIAKMIEAGGFSKILTFDLHNLAILGFFEQPLLNLTARDLLADYFLKKRIDETIVVAPDAGAIKSSTAFAQSLGARVVYLDKKRDLKTGQVKIFGMSGPVVGKEVVMIDDMIVTGSTLIAAAKYLKKAGASKIRVGATHHLYVQGAQEKIERSPIDELVVTDTVAARKSLEKVKILSVVDLLAREIKGELDKG